MFLLRLKNWLLRAPSEPLYDTVGSRVNDNKENDTVGRRGNLLCYIWPFPTLHLAGINKLL